VAKRKEGDVTVMISGTQINQVLKVYKAQGMVRSLSSGSQGGTGSVTKDDVKLSVSAQDMDRVREIVQKLPDIRYERVKPITDRIAAGTYTVDPNDIADKLLGRLLADKIR
jgi:flagellar biosynthesis anti-sigma factor FlgM